MRYLYIDGDNIGLKIEQSFLNNDEQSLIFINQNVNDVVSRISKYLKENNHEIIFSGADGIISKGGEINVSDLIDFIRLLDLGLTFSIGVGNSLSACYIALRYAKSLSKNIGIEFTDYEFISIEGKVTRNK